MLTGLRHEEVAHAGAENGEHGQDAVFDRVLVEIGALRQEIGLGHDADQGGDGVNIHSRPFLVHELRHVLL